MGVSEDRGQKTEDGNVARMKPRGIRDNVANIKICKKRGGWVAETKNIVVSEQNPESLIH